MKKLMILAASVAIACAASAASATWGFGSDSILDRNGEYLGDQTQGTAFLYLGTAAMTGASIDLTGLTLLAIAGQNADYTFGSPNSPVNLTDLSSDEAGQAYTLLLVEGDGLSALTEGKAYQMVVTTGTNIQMTDPMSGETWAAFTSDTAYDASAWKNLTVGSGTGPTPIPEPTSGLLMLLGMAGLALRRKQK